MKAPIRKTAAAFICFALVICALAGTVPAGAQEFAAQQLSQINEESPAKLDVTAATAYARKHWNDGKGYCAEFCYDVLKAGGFVINGSSNRVRAYTQYNHLVNELGLRSYYLGDGKVTKNADKIEEGDLVMWDLSYLLKGVTSDTVKISGSGGHIVYISVANGPFSKHCGHNRAKLDAPLETGGTHGMWLIKTSALAGNKGLEAKDITPTEYEIVVSGNIHMIPGGGLYYGSDGYPVTTERGRLVTIDKTCVAGGYTWGRISNSGWDWIVISHDRVREINRSPQPDRTGNDWIGDVVVLSAGNVRTSPFGRYYYRVLVAGSIRAWPFGDLRGDAATKIGEIISIIDTRYSGDWLWGRIDNDGWDWIALEMRDGTNKRYEFVTTEKDEIYTIIEQRIAGGWVWGRIKNTYHWIAIENLDTGEVRCAKTR